MFNGLNRVGNIDSSLCSCGCLVVFQVQDTTCQIHLDVRSALCDALNVARIWLVSRCLLELLVCSLHDWQKALQAP